MASLVSDLGVFGFYCQVVLIVYRKVKIAARLLLKFNARDIRSTTTFHPTADSLLFNILIGKH
jgi:hypothetical protein